MRGSVTQLGLVIGVFLLWLGASACSDAIDVFGGTALERGDGGGEPEVPPRDASTAPQRSDAGDPPTTAQKDAGKPPRVDTGAPGAPCSERCAADQICALDSC